MTYQFKTSRRILMPLWRDLRTKQENILSLLEKRDDTTDEFPLNLRLRRTICLLYNISNKSFLKTIINAKKYQGDIASNIIFLLEKRLDVTLFRAGFSSSIGHSKQLINHRHVFINNKLVTSPSYQLKAGDIFNVKDLKLENLNAIKPIKASNLEINYSLMTGIFLYKPDQVYYPHYFNILDLQNIIKR